MPGRILSELVNNDRCIGGITPQCARQAQRFYKMFVRGTCVTTTARAAEMVKLTENAFRDANIAFANELSLICDRHRINVWEVIDLANRHPRVNVLRPGPGVGGHCIAIDPWFIVHSAPDIARLIRTSREVNRFDDHLYSRARSRADRRKFLRDSGVLRPHLQSQRRRLEGKSGARSHPSAVARYGPRIKMVEPNIRELPAELSQHGAILTDLDEAIKRCEVAIVLVDHDQFKIVPLSERRHLAVLDTKGIWQDMPNRDLRIQDFRDPPASDAVAVDPGSDSRTASASMVRTIG